ncbi:MAG: A/G-specific adenine glycosylase [Nitrospinaceae bacterium]|nr:MAG: A/G-specific adenine glycosylase [Nitrospinaceae bacterium]
MSSFKTLKFIQTSLLNWYRTEKRDLPWRNTEDPYHILVSEFMLQQTQVKTVIPYYQRWLKSFPTADALARAREPRVLKHWEGLGYYSRARNLHRSAKLMMKEFRGKVPGTLDEILKLPGVGRYTAGAVLSIAFDQKMPVLDGNVKRVLSRLFCLKENGSSSASETRLWEVAEKMLPSKRSGDFNQALMELGATICLPKKPLCLLCPLNKSCMAKRNGVQEHFPPAKVKSAAKKIEVSAAVIHRNGKTYIQQRPQKGLMGGLWEFPGGKMEKGENPEECLIREIAEELGVQIKIKEKIMTIKHSYTQFRVTLHVFTCALLSGKIHATSCEQWKWVSPQNIDKYPFPAANVKILQHLKNNGLNGHEVTLAHRGGKKETRQS